VRFCIFSVDTCESDRQDAACKVGYSLAVRIPLRAVETARLREGDELTLAVGRNGEIVIKPAQRKYQLDELISKITGRNRHDETDWGPRVGKEAW
jgi:antitoxin MazE